MKLMGGRAELLGDRAKRGLVRQVEEEVRAQLPDSEVEVTADGLEVRGQGLLRRWLEDASLRFLLGKRR